MSKRGGRDARAGSSARGSSHPEHYARGYARWLWSESDLYASLTGEGAGSRTMADVEEVVSRLLPPLLPREESKCTLRERPRGESLIEPPRPQGTLFPALEKMAATWIGLPKPAALAHAPHPDPLAEDDADLLARFDALESSFRS